MTASFVEEEAALKLWFKAGTKLTQVLLENEPRPMVPSQWGVIKLMSSRPDGRDSVVFFDSGGERLPRTRCERTLFLKIAVEAFSQSMTLFALSPLERLRAAAVHPRLQAMLKTADLVFVGSSEIVNADREIDQRWISRFEMDAQFRWVYMLDGDVGADAASWIERVKGTGTFSNPDKTATYDADSTP